MGCVSRVEVALIEDEDSDLYGEAYAEFGPVGIEPSVRQNLEYILGNGGGSFNVSVYHPDDRFKMIDERKSREAVLTLHRNFIKLTEERHYNKSREIFEKSTDYGEAPQILIISNDTQMFTIDSEASSNGLSFQLDIRANTR